MIKGDISELIKNSRIEKGLSQRELARKCNVDNALISRIESGKVLKPGYLVLNKLSKELDIDFINLLFMAFYDVDELEELGIFEKVESIESEFEIKTKNIIDLVGINKFNRYSYGPVNRDRKLDIIKILQGYRKKEINENETITLISFCLDKDISQYIPDEQRIKYGINIDDLIN